MTCKQVFALTHTLSPFVGFKGQNIFSSDSGHAAYQMNRNVGHSQPMVIYKL